MIFAFAAIASLLIGPVAGSATGIADEPLTTLTTVVESISSSDPCSQPPSDPFSTPLLAGQYTDVGDVEVWEEGTILCVRYVLDGWCLHETHLALGDNIPTNNKGNPKIGHFPFSGYHDCVSEYTYTIADWACDGGTVDVAAHAVVSEAYVDLDQLAASLPDEVSMTTLYPGTEYGRFDSYWDMNIIGSPNVEYPLADGWYDDFCLDTDFTMDNPGTYDKVKVYPSYEFQLPGLDKVNYIVNNYYGAYDVYGDPAYSYCTIQRAIWTVVAQTSTGAGCDDVLDIEVKNIVNDAEANGVGYEPGCGGYLAIILEPVDESHTKIAQLTFAIITITECEPMGGKETAWGKGYGKFGGGSWATYFSYDECDEDDGRVVPETEKS